LLTALTLESEEFKVKKRKVDKDARALASISNGPLSSGLAALSAKAHSPAHSGAGASEGKVKTEGGQGGGKASKGGSRGGGGGRGGHGGGNVMDDDQLSTHSTDAVSIPLIPHRRCARVCVCVCVCGVCVCKCSASARRTPGSWILCGKRPSVVLSRWGCVT